MLAIMLILRIVLILNIVLILDIVLILNSQIVVCYGYCHGCYVDSSLTMSSSAVSCSLSETVLCRKLPHTLNLTCA